MVTYETMYTYLVVSSLLAGGQIPQSLLVLEMLNEAVSAVTTSSVSLFHKSIIRFVKKWLRISVRE